MAEVSNPSSGLPVRASVTDASLLEGLLFSGGPPQALARWLGLIRAGEPHLMRRALLTVAIGWLPLVVLTALRGDLIRPDTANSFLLDFGIHLRFLVAAPLLVLAQAVCVPRLADLARQFVDMGLIADADRVRYDAAVTSSQRLMNLPVVEVALTVLAYALVFALVKATPPEVVPSWHGRLNPFAASPAGWWALLISLPLLLLLLLGWLWRICVWSRFLWLMSRLQLQLDGTHPDHAGGVGFVSESLEAFLPLGFIVGVICAGPVVNQVLHHHANPLQFKSVAIGAFIVVALLCAVPLLVFVGRLLKERSRARRQYGAFAVRMDKRFHAKWLSAASGTVRTDQGPLDVSDLTGTNIANLLAANARAMRILPLESKSVGLLIVATLLPFVPVWLLVVPFDQVAKKLSSFLL